MLNTRSLTVLMLASLALAGCAEDKAPTTDPTGASDDPVQQELGGDVIDGAGNSSTGLGTPFLLSVAAGPDTPITAFRWRIPEGAIVRYQPIPEFADFIIEQLIFEMVPVFPNGTLPPEEFAILTFRLDGDAQLGNTILGVPVTGTSNDVVSTTPFEATPELTSRYLFLSAGSLEEGDEIGFVIAAKSATAAPFGLLLSPRADRPSDGEAAPLTAEELLNGRTALALEAAGTGTGFQYARYGAFRFRSEANLRFSESRVGPVSVVDQLPRGADAAASARVVTISASFPDAGFSRASGSFSGFDVDLETCPQSGTYELKANLHGTEVGHRSVLVEEPVGASGTVVGYPFFSAVGEGDGPAEASMALQFVNSCGIESLSFTQLDIGATILDLLGVPAATGGSSSPGLAGSIPPMIRGDSLIVYEDGVQTEFIGWGATHQPVVDVLQQAWAQQHTA